MSLLSAVELLELVESGVIEGVDRSSINAVSIDLHLGDTFLVEERPIDKLAIDLSIREKPLMHSVKNSIHLMPGQFCLGSTKEIFHLPNDISGHFMLTSSLARAGLQHSFSGLAAAGWHDSTLTLELSNLLRHHQLILRAGMVIGQIEFFRHNEVSSEFLYSTKGRYNNDKNVNTLKE